MSTRVSDIDAPPTGRGRLAALGALVRRLALHRFARVAYVGATSSAVDFAVFNALLLGLDAGATAQVLAANTAAFGCAMVVNYALNARFSFGMRMTRRSAITYVLFTLVGLVFYNGNLLWIRALLDADTALLLNASKVLAMGLLVVWNYLGYHFVVFRPHARPSLAEDAS